MTNALDTALALIDRGLGVFPLAAGSKEPRKGSHGVKDATRDAATVRAWWRDQPDANVAAAPGPGFVVIDLDCKHGIDGIQAWRSLHRELFGDAHLIKTVTARTTTGGRHLYFSVPEPLGNTVGQLAVGIDTRGVGGYVVAPPSIISGKAYEWVFFDGQEIAELPPEILALLKARKSADTASSRAVLEGARNETLFRLGCSLRAKGQSDETILAELRAMNLSFAKPPLPAAEVDSIWRSVQRYRREFSLTEAGNAERFATRYEERIAFVPERKIFYVPSSCHTWQPDRSGITTQWMKSVAEDIFAEACAADDGLQGQKANWAKQSLGAARIRNALDLARTEPSLVVQEHEFDQHPLLLAVENGIVDLATGELRPGDLTLRLTRHCSAAFDPKATCDRWLRFLDTIFAGDQALIDYIQRLGGYCLTGKTSEQQFTIFWGSGANGKSTLLEVWKAILGEYATSTPPELIQQANRQPHGASPSLVRLKGARLVTTVETEGNHRLAESLIKQMTGGDSLVARGLYQDEIEFAPTWKLILATNHRPEVRGTDHAIWRRIHLVPFTVQIPPQERVEEYHDVLLAERAGILNWLIAGCRAWQERKLDPPPSVREATETYRDEQDRIGRFLEDQVFEGPDVSRSLVYGTYSLWCKSNGYQALGAAKFYAELRERGFQEKKVDGQRLVTGLVRLARN